MLSSVSLGLRNAGNARKALKMKKWFICVLIARAKQQINQISIVKMHKSKNKMTVNICYVNHVKNIMTLIIELFRSKKMTLW